MNDLLQETQLWIEDEHTKEEYDDKLTEVNGKINPIMMKIYSEGKSEMPGSVPESMPSESMPSVDEVD